MTRQYIGARYVPIFFDGAQGTEWLPNTQYEPLTIVTRNGNSYTSKKAVPAAIGAPENNAAYWASTGIYNQQVEELRQNVENLAADVDTFNDRIEIVASDLETTADNLHAVAANTAALRRFIILGDSYGNRVNTENRTYFDILKNALGLDSSNLYHNSIGGAAFAQTVEGHKYIELLQAIAPSVPAHETITDIIVQCGANDLFYAVADTRSEMVTFINYAKSNFPNAKITLFPCGLVFKRDQMRNRIATISAFKACAGYGAVFYGPAEFILEDPHLLESDLIHPNASGVNTIARGIVYAILGAPIETSFRYIDPTILSITLAHHSDVTFSNIASHYVEANRNGVLITCGNTTSNMIEFTTSSAVTLNRLEEIRITVANTLICLPDGNCFTGYISLDGAEFIPAFIAVATIDDVNILRVFPKVAAPTGATRFGIGFEFTATLAGSISA